MFRFIACILCIGIGGFLWITAMTEDIENAAIALSTLKKHEYLECLKQLCDVIWYDAKGKQLSRFSLAHKIGSIQSWPNLCLSCNRCFFRVTRQLADMAQPMLMIVLSYGCVASCGALLVITMELVQ